MRKAKEAIESPLVPNAVLRRMYEVMLRLRAMDAAGSRRRSNASLRGEEAARAGSLLCCAAGDLVSDAGGGERMAAAVASGSKQAKAAAEGPRWLPGTADAGDRMQQAMGAAAALRAQGGGRLVLAFAGAAEMKASRWKAVLSAAGAAELPVVFVVLPGAGKRRQGWLSDRAQGWGVPGMPVDASDAVALYRVMQESAARARGGDGPALLECVAWRPQGAAAKAVDGVETMRRLLTERGLLGRAG